MSFVWGIAAGYLLSWISMFIGTAVGERKQARRNAIPEQPKLKCQCGHLYSAHKNGGKCTCISERRNYTDYNCACTMYIGPDPMLSGLWIGSVHEPPSEKVK